MKKILIILICLLITQYCFGISETKKISLDSAIQLALKENPQKKMAELDTLMAKKDVKIAGQLHNPSLQFFQNLGRAGAGNPQQIGLSYGTEFLRPFKKKKAAKLMVEVAENNKAFYENELRFKVKYAYFNLLEKKTNLEIAESQKDLFKQIFDNTQKESNAGRLPKTDVVLAKIEYNRSVMDYNEAKTELISARNEFNAVMNSSELEFDTIQDALNEDYSTLLTIKPTDNTLNFEEIKNFVYEHRFDLISAKKEVENKKAELAVAKSLLVPDLEIQGGWSYQTPSVSESSTFENGAYIAASLINIPVVYQFKPEIEKAKYEIEKAELKYQDLLIDVTRSITDAWRSYSVARDNLNFYNKELLKNSEELLDTSYKSLNKKEISMTDFLMMRKIYLELMFGYSNALKSYYIAYAQLLREMNISDIKDIKSEKI